jgi:hypothetical protein
MAVYVYYLHREAIVKTIGSVAFGIHQAQVRNPVIGPITIHVIDLKKSWVGAVVQCPGETMGFEAATP